MTAVVSSTIKVGGSRTHFTLPEPLERSIHQQTHVPHQPLDLRTPFSQQEKIRQATSWSQTSDLRLPRGVLTKSFWSSDALVGVCPVSR